LDAKLFRVGKYLKPSQRQNIRIKIFNCERRISLRTIKNGILKMGLFIVKRVIVEESIWKPILHLEKFN
jgi:hypothetical protein